MSCHKKMIFSIKKINKKNKVNGIVNFEAPPIQPCKLRDSVVPPSSRGGGSYFQLGGQINYSLKVGGATQLLLVQ